MERKEVIEKIYKRIGECLKILDDDRLKNPYGCSSEKFRMLEQGEVIGLNQALIFMDEKPFEPKTEYNLLKQFERFVKERKNACK